MSWLLKADPLTGERTTFDYDHSTGTSVITTLQNCSPMLEWAKARRNDDDESWRGRNNDMWLAALVPNTVIVKWRRELGVDFDDPDHWPAVRRLLNGDYAYLKTAPITL